MLTDKFNQFFNKWNGQYCEVVDPSNKNQCVDLAVAYLDFLGIPRSANQHVYAYEFFTKPSNEAKNYFDYIANSPSGVPIVGDLVVFGTSPNHICISNGVGNTNSFQSFDENWPVGSVCHIVTHNYVSCLGWLRPKNQDTPPPPPPPDPCADVKTQLSAITSDRDSLKTQLAAVTTDRDSFVEQLTQEKSAYAELLKQFNDTQNVLNNCQTDLNTCQLSEKDCENKLSGELNLTPADHIRALWQWLWSWLNKEKQ